MNRVFMYLHLLIDKSSVLLEITKLKQPLKTKSISKQKHFSPTLKYVAITNKKCNEHINANFSLKKNK